MADNFVAACEHAAEALLSFQNITRDDVQRLAATSTSTTVDNNQAENQTTTIYAQNYHEDFLAIVLDDFFKVIQVLLPLVALMLLIVLRTGEDGLSATKNAGHRPKQHLKLQKEDDLPPQILCTEIL